ncbi:MAG TPA: DUF433 domain-containing protein [Tepidisphaeraceae bacterium]|nr:DUF433 domain-containing protein [Tepidisphaeraceae bacterium]
MKPIIHSDPEIVSGTPVFYGTRVPVQTLLDYIEGDERLSEFLDQFPTVTKEQVMDFLRAGMSQLLSDAK